MGLVASEWTALASPRRFDARLELGGLPALSALVLAWPITVALIVAARLVSFGEITFLWALPWVVLPLFWPALVLLPVAAHIPTRAIPPALTAAGLVANSKMWLPLAGAEATVPRRALIAALNNGAVCLLPPLLYGLILAWLASRRDRSGPADMRGFRPYRAAALALFVLASVWFGLPFLMMAIWLTPSPRGDVGGLGVLLGIVAGGLILYFPWMAVIAGIVTISIVHGIPRPYTALAFPVVALASCLAISTLTSSNVLTSALSAQMNMRFSLSLAPAVLEFWRSFAVSAAGVTIYGVSLWLTRRRVVARPPVPDLSMVGSVDHPAGNG